LDPQLRMQTHRLSLPSALVWLLAVAVVGVLGTILLTDSGISAELPLRKAIGWVWLVELLLYLVVLLAPAGEVPVVGVFAGLIVAFVVRAGLAGLCAIINTHGSLSESFGFYYAGHWLGALVQVLVVAIYLWLVRSLLERGPAPRWGPILPSPGDAEDHAERQRLLLAALRESDEDEQAPAAPVPGAEPEHVVTEEPSGESEEAQETLEETTEEAEARPSWVEAVRTDTEQPAAQAAEAPARPSEDVAQEAETDTDRFEAVQAPEQEVELPIGVEALPPALEEAAREAIARYAYYDGARASGGITPGNRVMVWVTPGPVAVRPMGLAADGVVGWVAVLAEVARIGTARLVLAVSNTGAFGLAVTDGSYVIIAQPDVPNLGSIAHSLRETARSLGGVHLPEAEAVVEDLSAPECQTDEEFFAFCEERVGAMVSSWPAQVCGLHCGDEAVIAVAGEGADFTKLAAAAVALSQALDEIARVLEWRPFDRALVSGTMGAVGIGSVELPQGPECLVAVAADSPQVALVNVKLDRIATALGEA